MEKFIIEGGQKLSGTIPVRGSKNAALPLIAASLLVPEVCLTNVPRIKDVEHMLALIEELGGSFEWVDRNEVIIRTQHVSSAPLGDTARKLRASTLFAGALLGRFKEAELPYPGGDLIGARPLDTHLNAFEKLGVSVSTDQERLSLSTGSFNGGVVALEESSVTATENVLILAASVDHDIEIRLAAAEPHVQCLAQFLSKAGAEIEGIGTTTLRIKGAVDAEKVRFCVIPDELEVSSFAALAAATKSTLTIEPIAPEFLDAVLLQMQKMNIPFSVKGNTLTVSSPSESYTAARLQSGLFPKLVTDHLPPFAVLATQAKGATLVHDWLFEARQSYLRELIKMGADVTIMDPHRALVMGPTPLYGKEVSSYDIRSGMAMIIAALAAQGQTIIHDIEHVDRGYENLEERLAAAGAHIKRVKE